MVHEPGRALERVAGALSLAAGGVHGVVSPAHVEEWWGYGLFFIAAGTAQVLFGLALLTQAIGPHSGPAWRTWHRRLLWSGIAGNVAIFVLYFVTRTVGVPAGPEVGQVEPVGALDVVSKVLEALLVIALAVLLRQRARAASP